MVRLVAVQRPGHVAAQHELLEAVHQRAHAQAVLEPVLEVAVLVELGVEPALLEGPGVGAQFVVLAPGRDGLVGGLGREHAGLDGGVAALDAADVQVARVAADERAAGEHGLGQGTEAAGVDGARAIRQALGRDFALGVLEVPADVGVGLPALEFLERAQVGVGVAQAGDEAHGHLVALQVVEEGAAVGVVLHGPAGGVHDEAGLVARGVDLPQLLDADAEALRVAPGVELVARDELLAQVAACAFGEDGVLGQELHAELEVLGGLAVLAQAHVAGGHALDGTVVVVEHFGGGKAGEDLHAERFGLLAQPLGDGAQADDVVAVVVRKRRQEHVGHAKGRALAQKAVGVVGDGLVQGGALFLPVGDELGQRLGVHDGAREDVRARRRALLQHHDGDVLAFFRGQLLEADGRGQAPGAAADDHHVVFHGFAGTELGEDFFVCHRHTRSRMTAMPCPTPMHMVHSA